MRFILITGKGGVGKTTVAAATALRSAELGYRTLVISSDAAHSLADSFDTPLSGEPQLVAPNLWGQELDLAQEMEAHWGTIREWVMALMACQGTDEVVADELAILPGMEELATLLYIARYHDESSYQVVIVDCAPSGETLRLLGFPEALGWWMERILAIKRKALRPVIGSLLGLPMPEDGVFESVEHLLRQVLQTHHLLASPQSSVRLVVNAEKMVIKEAQRTFTCLNLYGYATDLIVCNRLIPGQVADSYFDSWKQSQTQHYQAIEEAFTPVPTRTVPLLQQEVIGLPMLQQVGRLLYDGENPAKVFFEGQAQSIRKENGNYILTVALPFSTKADISLVGSGSELIIKVGSYRRNVALPHALVGLEVQGAQFENTSLKITFSGNGKRTKGSRQGNPAA